MQRITSQLFASRQAASRRIRCELRTRYAEELALAGIFGRVALWFRIEWETRVELRKQFPPRALYWTQAGR